MVISILFTLGTLVLLLILLIYNFLCFIVRGFSYKASYLGRGEPPLQQRIDVSLNKKFFSNDIQEAIRKVLNQSVKPILYYDDIPERLPYRSSKFAAKRTTHIGQLKLFLTELEFLTECLTKHTDKAYVIYAGSAPSNKIDFLGQMFPNVVWILVDPNEHLIMFEGAKTQYDNQKVIYFKVAKGNKFKVSTQTITMFNGSDTQTLDKKSDTAKIDEYHNKFDDLIQKTKYKPVLDFIEKSASKYFLVEDIYTEDLSKLFNKLKGPKYFISDIRTKQEMDFMPGDIDTLWNDAQQLIWLNALKPKKFMLKFKCPYFEEDLKLVVNERSNQSPYKETFAQAKKLGVDFVGEYKKGKFKYFKKDHVLVQAFAGQTSSESRLVASSVDKFQYYDSKEYEDKFFYYNRVHRNYGFHEHSSLDRTLGVDGCGDCGITHQSFSNYYGKYNLPGTPIQSIRALMKIIRRTFFTKDSAHGTFYQIDTMENIEKDQQLMYALQFTRENAKLFRNPKSVQFTDRGNDPNMFALWDVYSPDTWKTCYKFMKLLGANLPNLENARQQYVEGKPRKTEIPKSLVEEYSKRYKSKHIIPFNGFDIDPPKDDTLITIDLENLPILLQTYILNDYVHGLQKKYRNLHILAKSSDRIITNLENLDGLYYK
jgi:hypothetical protein